MIGGMSELSVRDLHKFGQLSKWQAMAYLNLRFTPTLQFAQIRAARTRGAERLCWERLSSKSMEPPRMNHRKAKDREFALIDLAKMFKLKTHQLRTACRVGRLECRRLGERIWVSTPGAIQKALDSGKLQRRRGRPGKSKEEQSL